MKTHNICKTTILNQNNNMIILLSCNIIIGVPQLINSN